MAQLQDGPGKAAAGLAALSGELRRLKQSLSEREWDRTIGEGRRHPVRAILHEDPLTERAYRQPRGYQGDAELLDMIFHRDWRGHYDRQVSSRGRAIFGHTIDSKSSSATRARRTIVASLIDRECDRTDSPDILSVGCGHLRELSISHALREGRIGRFVGLDQDPLNLDVVEREYARHGVQGIRGSIKLLLNGPLSEEKFDLIYSAGMLDYLDDELSRRLIGRMFEMLNPGGRLLAANYLPDIDDIGYMETFTGWRPTCRSSQQLHDLAAGIPEDETARKCIFRNSNCNVGFFEIEHC